MTQKIYNRWLVVIGGIIIQFCLGAVYAWSVFRKPIETLFGWSTSQVSLAFTINLAMIPLAMILGGKLMSKLGPKLVAILGGAMIFVGLFIASKTRALWMLYLGYGFLAGGGIGVAYGVPITTLVKWFPDKRGTITGLAVGGLGFGSLFFTRVAFSLITSFGPLNTFTIIGAIIFAGVFIASQLIRVAPDGYSPEGWTPQTSNDAKTKVSKYNFTPKEMIRTPQYYIIFVIYIFANIAGLMIIGHASPIGQKVANLSPAEASAIVGLLGLVNSLGRLFWGAASDKLGRFRAVIIMFIINAVAMFSMNFLSTFWLYAIGVSMITFCFGGAMGTYPSLTADTFGPKYVTMNYGLIFLAYSVGAIIGPQLAAYVKEISGGGYHLAFIITGTLCSIGAIMAMLFKAPIAPINQLNE